MRVSTIATSALALAAGASAQSLNTTYLGEIVSALTSSNLTGLAGLAQAALNSTNGALLFAGLPGSNKTLFAPTNAAIANISTDGLTGDDIASILSYHVLNTSVTNISAVAPMHMLVRSFYNSGELPGNATQPVVLSTMGTANSSFIAEAFTNVSITAGPIAVANLQVYLIDQVLMPPSDLATVATELVPSIAGTIQQAGLLDTLANTTGVTIFAPIDTAVSAIAETLGSLNTTVVTDVLLNHVILGDVVYSTELTSSNYTSAGGSMFMFTSNSSGTYVTSGMSTAKIVQSDILISNGVVHAIDSVLVNTNSNASAAGAAASSYSMAATATTGNGGVIGSATAASTGASSTGGTSAATKAFSLNFGAIGGLAVAAIGVLGGVLVL